MKYLFADTNTYIVCALLTEPKHSPETIKKLIELLDTNKVKIILPEVVEIEFFRAVDAELSKIKKAVDKFVKIIKEKDNFPDYLKSDKDKYIQSAKRIFSKRKFSSESAKESIKTLFEGKNIIKIPITHEIFINAYKRALAGKKPYKLKWCTECNELKNIIDADCLIFESILFKIKELGKIELIFCSGNKVDFASFDKSKNNHILHPELESSLPEEVTTKYYFNLVDALESEFQTEINETEKNKINKYYDYVSNIKFVSPSWAEILKQMSPVEYALKAAAASPSLAEIAKQMSPMEDALKAVAVSPSWAEIVKQMPMEDALKAVAVSPSLAEILKQMSPMEDALKTITSQMAKVKEKDTSESKEENKKKKTT